MIIENTLTKFGFIKDEDNSKLKDFFKNNSRLKEIHIDIYPENPLVSSSAPFMLLSRTIEKNIIISNDGDRLVLKRNDGFDTYFMNVLFSEIKGYYKDICTCFEFILNIQNIWYRVTILN